MAGIIPIPNTRISSLLVRQRLTQQYQTDQLDLFRLQEQLSTGVRFALPSEDAPAAFRAISLQQLIERKGQLETNILTGRDFLRATDDALASVAGTLADMRGEALGVVGTLNSQEARDVALNKVNETLSAMLRVANRKFRGRFLFAGLQSNVLPYQSGADFVKYTGDANTIRSYLDIGVLFSTNSPGTKVFGGISESVSGSVDLNPELNSDTLLSALRGGRGVETAASLSISDGTTTSIVDVSQAVTMGDIVRLIEENPPSGREISVSITGNGLSLTLLDPLSLGGNFTIEDVGNGTIAQQLGIVESTGVAPGIAISGSDLDPALLLTTQLDRLLGTKAQALLTSVGTNNDILIKGASNGASLNGVTVQLVDDELLRASSGLAAGQEVAEYDLNARQASAALTLTGIGNDLIITANSSGTAFNNVGINLVAGGNIGDAASAVYNSVNKTLTITVDDDGETTVQKVIDEIALDGNFTATHDNSVEGSLNPGAFVNGGVAGNTGNSGGAAKTLYVRVKAGGSTATNVVNAINTQGTFTAKLHAFDSTSTGDSGSGIVALNSTAVTSGGSGVALDLTSGIRVVNGGATYDIDVSQAESVADLLNMLNSSEAGLFAEINSGGNGINVHSRISGTDFQIGENGGQLATQLGIRTFTQQTSLSSLNYGEGVTTQSGFDLPTATGTDLTIDTIDGQSFQIDLSVAASVSDVVAAINAVTGPSVTATAVTSGNVSVVQLVDNSAAGTDSFTVTQTTGSLAAQYLGIIPNNGDTAIVSGGNTLVGNNSNYIDLTVTDKNGQQYGVDLSAALTVGDVIDAINAATTVNVTAQLATDGNGIELVDQTGGGGDLVVTQVEGSQAAELLGLVPTGESSQSSSTAKLTGTDQHFLQADSVFTTLFRLRDALQANDVEAVDRALDQIDDDIDRVTFARADVGSRQQGLDVAQRNLEDEDIQLRSALSLEIDVDLVEAISQVTARQISLEASLRAMANILQLSLLNFI